MTTGNVNAERQRQDEAREQRRPVDEMGPVPLGTPVGHGPRGLQRQRRRVELPAARSRALACLPLGRGRAGRDLRRPAAAVLRARALERPGPDHQGASVRPDEQRGQSRRGRQGVLLLPRLDADALVHEVPLQVPAGGLPVRRPPRDEPRPWPRRRGVRAARYRRVRRRPLFRRPGRVREGGSRRPPRRDHRHEPRARVRDPRRPADHLVPEHLVMGRRRAEAAAARREHAFERGHRGVAPGPGRPIPRLRGLPVAPLHGERDQHRPTVRDSLADPVRQGRHRPVHRRGRTRRGEPGAERDEGSGPLRADGSGGWIADRSPSPVGDPACRLARPRPTSTRSSTSVARRPTRSTRRSSRRPWTPIRRS